MLEKSGRPIPVAGCPLVVENPRPGQPPLVVYRSRWGLQAVKSDSGDLVWRTTSGLEPGRDAGQAGKGRGGRRPG